MEVVEQRVAHAGVGQVAGERLLPHPLGHPHAVDRRAEAVGEPLGVARDLPDAIARRNHRQDRFVERAADDLHPPGRHERGQAIEIFRMPRRPAIPSASRSCAARSASRRILARTRRGTDDSCPGTPARRRRRNCRSADGCGRRGQVEASGSCRRILPKQLVATTSIVARGSSRCVL